MGNIGSIFRNPVGMQLIRKAESEQNIALFREHTIRIKQLEECYKENEKLAYRLAFEKQKYENMMYRTINATNLFNEIITELVAFRIKIDNDIASLDLTKTTPSSVLTDTVLLQQQ